MRQSDARCDEGQDQVVWMGVWRGTRSLGRCWVGIVVDDDLVQVVFGVGISL